MVQVGKVRSSHRSRANPDGNGLRWDKERIAVLFRRYHEDNDESAREEIIEEYSSLVRFLAMRFNHRGESLDDLIQVGTIGLLKAVDRFEVERDLAFSTFATPTILGELKRNFRDKGWALKVPRRMQELSAKVNKATDELTVKLRHAPTIGEIAEYLDVSIDEVIDAMDAAAAYATTSYDSTDWLGGAEGELPIIERYGQIDRGMVLFEEHEVLARAFDSLSPLERIIIKMRYFDERTQTDISSELGISQMQVSRILRRSIDTLRTLLSDK